MGCVCVFDEMCVYICIFSALKVLSIASISIKPEYYTSKAIRLTQAHGRTYLHLTKCGTSEVLLLFIS